MAVVGLPMAFSGLSNDYLQLLTLRGLIHALGHSQKAMSILGNFEFDNRRGSC